MIRGTVVAIPADLHCGSVVGLMPPGQWRGKSGYHDPTPAQKIIWKQFEECSRRVAELRKGRRLIVISAGDAVDGYHHETKQLVTTDEEEQERIHIECMDWFLKKTGFGRDDLLYYLAGTVAHVRGNAQAEERIARDLGAVPYLAPSEDSHDGQYVWPALRLKVHNTILDVAHHGGYVSKRNWLRENTLRNIVKSVYYDALEEGLPLPNYWIRADKHQHIATTYDGRRGSITGIVTPAFQLRTEYAWNVAGENTLSTLGMLIVIIDQDRTWWECPQITFAESPLVEV